MKRAFPYLIGAAVLVLLAVVLLASRKAQRRFDERITLRQRDKIPYGTAVARQLLPRLFPQAAVYNDARYPGSWDDIDVDDSAQAVILVADYLNANQEELEYLEAFVDAGNYVFIIARSLSDDAADFFGLDIGSDYSFLTDGNDSLLLQLSKPVFSEGKPFTYPGKRYEGRIIHRDSASAAALGTAADGIANFVGLKKGSGRFFIHTSPLAFSNYFILHKKNAAYYQQALSVIPADVKAVLWNEYYLEKLRDASGRKSPNWLATLLKYPAFRWGLLTALFFLLLYGLLGMRRRQRAIPPHEKPTNDALDFIKTLGRLYYDKGDHRNLANKMGAYFLEHVRSTYKIPTHTLDADFVRLLHRKSGYPEVEISNIVSEMDQLRQWPAIGEERLAQFHRQLELFYQNT